MFITTSDPTTQAKEFARSVEGVVLMDGLRLVGLMIDNEVGVTSRLLRVPKLDSDYFDETWQRLAAKAWRCADCGI